MSIDAMNAVFKCSELSSSEKLVSIYISDKVNDVHNWEFYGGMDRLILETALYKQTVYNTMKSLLKNGFITLLGKRGRTKRYRFNIERYKVEQIDYNKISMENHTNISMENHTNISMENQTLTKGVTQDVTQVKKTKAKKESEKEIQDDPILERRPKQTESEQEMIDLDFQYQDTLYQSEPIAIGDPLAPFELTPAQRHTFNVFWELYPVKKAKKRAQTLWFSQKCHLKSKIIIEKLEQQVKSDRHYLEGYAPNPTTYIQQERWEDEIQKRNGSMALSAGNGTNRTGWAKPKSLEEYLNEKNK